VGGDQIEYPGEKSTRNAGLTTAKILINIVISTKGAIFLVVDIKTSISTPPSRDMNIWSSIYPLSHRR
jgi:orotate phosphoribosyltransferase-like protein